MTISIIIPAKNEGSSLSTLLPKLVSKYPDAEIIVVNDGSTDNTDEVCQSLSIKSIKHPKSLGNGASIKRGAREAKGDILVFMDGDGQHDPEHIDVLLNTLHQGYDMVIGARSKEGQANIFRHSANAFYNKFSSWITGQKVLDLTSGFRVVRAEKFKQFIYILPNGFSYPTTITMCFMRSGFPITYIPISVNKRLGKSHLKPIKDGIRFLLIIFKVGTLYSPIKIFFPISAFFFLTGFSYYIFTFLTSGRFTNMSALLLSISVLIFLIGLVSEQITSLLYSKS
jgi:glycosyltransferase involved in cell wall biosynthesis